MRAFVGATVLAAVAAAGCNELLGIDPVSGPPPADAIGAEGPPLPRVPLTFMAAQVVASAPSPTLQFAAIGDLELVRVGAQGAPLVPTTYDDGGFGADETLSGTPWRFEYTRAGRPPVEVQWTATFALAHYVEPLFGPVTREPVPPGSRYVLDLINDAGQSFPRPHMFGTGIWIDQALPAGPAPFQVDMAATVPLDGPRGKAANTIGWVNYGLENRADQTSCLFVELHAPFVAGALDGTTQTMNGMLSNVLNPAVGFAFSRTTLGLVTGNPTLDSRLQTVLFPRSVDASTSRALIGVAPSDKMPLFTRHLDGRLFPVTLPFVDCTQGTGVPDKFSPPTTLHTFLVPRIGEFPVVAYADMYNTRQVNGVVSLPSGIASAIVLDRPTSATTLEPDFRVPLAREITLGAADLTGDADRVRIAAGDRVLAWSVDQPALSVDYWEIWLYRVSGGNLLPERVTVLADPLARSASLDQMTLVPGSEYVIAIRSMFGRPNAGSGDFKAVRDQQRVGTIFTRTFLQN